MLRLSFIAIFCLTFLATPTLLTSPVSAVDLSGSASEPATDREVYGEGVRPTPWLAPDDERSGFHLPPNFEARLFAAEPQIAKPLNMAFDQQGRMWVTQSIEYPYPAKSGAAPSDAVMILRDSDGDGRVNEVTQFAEGLNIPIGILPYGTGCFCFSIPNLYYLQDTDGDGRCDRRDIVLGPFDTTRDTHGMVNSLRDGGDGWIYACHGFNNQSQVAGSDGHLVTMQSGNTFRFRADGSRVELYTQGQVNPFGMTQDEWGYRYTADCHSKPISQLIRGACYPSFGRPDDGLGYLPPTVEHLHGSTAISGVVYVATDSPLVPLRGQFLSGNVMTSRLNRNALTFNGATARGTEMGDFMTSEDPWFRPVDLHVGPDGFIYVADFYNKIIGHYEVPLEHPGRDRKSGRIWQIRYTGETESAADVSDTLRIAALKKLSLKDADYVTRIGESMEDESAKVRVAAWHLASESNASSYVDSIADGLADPNAHVVRAAAEFAGIHGSERGFESLKERLQDVPESDPVLRQTIRIALRSLLQRLPDDSSVWQQMPDPLILPILMAIESPESSRAILRYLKDHFDAHDADAMLLHAATHTGETSFEECLDLAKKMVDREPSRRWRLLDGLCRSQNARPGNIRTSLRRWANELVDDELAHDDDWQGTISWFASVAGKSNSDDWGFEDRMTSDGQSASMRSSRSRGEQYIGALSSDYFAAPQQIAFWLSGHNGHPDRADHQKNSVRLVSTNSGDVLRESFPPRNNSATRIQWDTSDLKGSDVRIELIDNDNGDGYAWLAIGGVELDGRGVPTDMPEITVALQWIVRLGLDEKISVLQTILKDKSTAPLSQVEIARTIATVQGRIGDAVILQYLVQCRATRLMIANAIAATESREANSIAASTQALCNRLSATEQVNFATTWATSGADPDALIAMGRAGWIGASVFTRDSVSEPLLAKVTDDQRAAIEVLTENIDTDAINLQLLASLQASVQSLESDSESGRRLYTQHCSACHQLRGEGAVVGPQLDGAVTRSVVRLLEDIVVPNLNVDQAFRSTSFLLDDGRVIVGLIRVESPSSITVVETNGKPVSFDPELIEQRREGGNSLMPSNFGEVMSEQLLADLIRFVRGT